MKKGGYQIIDLSIASPFTAGEAQEVSGVGYVIQHSNRKRLIISGLTLGGVEYPDFGVILTSSDGNYSGNFTGHTITVTGDNITITTQA